jgi:hypothetical protein
VRKQSVSSDAWFTPASQPQDIVLKFDTGGQLTEVYIQEDDPVFWAHGQPNTLRSDSYGLGSGSLVMKQFDTGDGVTTFATRFTYADPASTGLSYLTFGWWSAGPWSSTPANYGSYAAGAQTPTTAVPSTGTAQFTGALAAEGLETPFSAVAAPITINVDFGGRTAAFSSANFRDAQGVSYAGTALTGVLNFGSGGLPLAGQLTSTGYAGPANAYFYGPAAEEIGGTFLLSPTDPSSNGRVVGGFGAKR